MTTDLTDLVDSAIDAAIRSFRSGDYSSYVHWNSELQHIESLLGDFLSTLEGQHVFARVRAHRIAMAFDVGRHELILELNDKFVRDVPVDHPSYFTVASLRACCLHRAGAHGEEVREILELVRKAEIQNHEYISYLVHLATMHPGSIPQDRELFEKMWKAIAELRALGYGALPTPEESEQTVLEQLAEPCTKQSNLDDGQRLEWGFGAFVREYGEGFRLILDTLKRTDQSKPNWEAWAFITHSPVERAKLLDLQFSQEEYAALGQAVMGVLAALVKNDDSK